MFFPVQQNAREREKSLEIIERFISEIKKDDSIAERKEILFRAEEFIKSLRMKDLFQGRFSSQ